MNLLDDLKTQRTDRTPAWDGAVRAMETGRRRRLGRSAAVAGTALLVAGVAAGIGVVSSSGHDGRFGVAPAATGPAPLAEVDGVEVTWLPAGYQPNNALLGDRNLGELGTISSYQEFHDPETRTPRVHSLPRPSVTGLSLSVGRDTQVDLAAASTAPLFRASGFKPSWTTVRGHRALLMSRPASELYRTATFRLLWAENSSLTLEVDAFDGTTLEQAERLAASLVVHPSPTSSAQTNKTVADIRAAFKRAYTAPNPTSVALSAVEDGPTVAPTLEKLRKLLPDSVNTSSVTTGDIRFLGPTEALVDSHVSFRFMGLPTVNDLPETVKLIDGSWKVSRASFCTTIGTSGASCPESFYQS